MQTKISTLNGWKYNILYILTWYFFSTSLSIYNKTLMGKEHYNFNLPLLMSAVHSGIHTVITRILIKYYHHKVESYSTTDYILNVVPCGIAAAVEICCANASLVIITLSFYTMIKSSTPVWVLLFSFLFGFEKPKLNLILIISVIVFGVWLTIDGQPKFDFQGFILVLIAAIASGLRWNMTQYLMKRRKRNDEQQQQNSPISTMYHTSPVMFITMLLLSLFIEKPFQQQQQVAAGMDNSWFDSFIWRSIISLVIMAIGGILAFIMTLAELYLIKSTSTVTLSVAGISKEIVVISLSVFIYGDVLTTKTYIGLFVSIIGIIGYNYYKYTSNITTAPPSAAPAVKTHID